MLKHLIFLSVIIGIVVCAPTINDGRVVGGYDANIEDYPYQISIRAILDGQELHVCGGSILNENTILTAAHCVDWEADFFVRAGSSLHASGGQVVDVTEIHLHPRWDLATIDFDVAILKIDSLVFDNTVQPIELPEPHEDVPAGTNVTLTGWGLLNTGGIMPDVLQAVHKPIMDRDECRAMHEDIPPIVTERNICAGEEGAAACGGDSGGPLVWNRAVIGIVSWGVSPCGMNGFPTVYMRTSYFLDFILFYL